MSESTLDEKIAKAHRKELVRFTAMICVLPLLLFFAYMLNQMYGPTGVGTRLDFAPAEKLKIVGLVGILPLVFAFIALFYRGDVPDCPKCGRPFFSKKLWNSDIARSYRLFGPTPKPTTCASCGKSSTGS